MLRYETFRESSEIGLTCWTAWHFEAMVEQAFYDLTKELKSFHDWDEPCSQYQQQVCFLCKELRRDGYRGCSEPHCHDHTENWAFSACLPLSSRQYKRFSNTRGINLCQDGLYESTPCNQVLKILKQMQSFFIHSWTPRKGSSHFFCSLCLAELHKRGRRRLSGYLWGTQWRQLNMTYYLKPPL